jgi:predicted nucleic acid-binding protein
VVEPLVVDANAIISALLGGAAREVLFSRKFVLYSTQHTLFEVEKYISRLAEKLGRPEGDLFREFELLPIIACQPREYDDEVQTAIRLIGARDPKDVQILSLTLRLRCPIWTDDRDFDDLAGVSVLRTTDVLALMKQADQ